jgi:hypothetical protein
MLTGDLYHADGYLYQVASELAAVVLLHLLRLPSVKRTCGQEEISRASL